MSQYLKIFCAAILLNSYQNMHTNQTFLLGIPSQGILTEIIINPTFSSMYSFLIINNKKYLTSVTNALKKAPVTLTITITNKNNSYRVTCKATDNAGKVIATKTFTSIAKSKTKTAIPTTQKYLHTNVTINFKNAQNFAGTQTQHAIKQNPVLIKLQ